MRNLSRCSGKWRAAISFGFLCCVLGGLACDDGVDPTADGAVAPTDSGAADAAAPPIPVTVGVGINGFEPLLAGATVELVLGPQGGGRMGGYHIWTGVRVVGFDPVGILVTITVREAANRTERARVVRRLQLQPDGEGFVAFGLNAILDDCCAVVGGPIIIVAAVEDSTGKTGSAEVEVNAGGICPDGNMRNICP